MGQISALQGKKILLTRPVQQSAAWAAQLSTLGAVPLIFPLIETRAVEVSLEHKQTLRRLKDFDYLLFTSSNGVKFFMELLKKEKIGIEKLQHLIIGAIGEVTADYLGLYGLHAAIIPHTFASNELAAIVPEPMGKNILIPSGNMARDELSNELTAEGAKVQVFTVYETVKRSNGAEELLKLFNEGIDVVAFASPSTIEAFMELKPAGAEAPLVACIGPVTSKKAKEFNLSVAIQPERFTVQALTQAIEEYYAHDTKTEKAADQR